MSVTKRPRATVEWPTLALVIAVHLGFAAVTWDFNSIPPWIALPAGACLVALHSSLQHEAIHGHPTRWSRVNALLVSLPLGLVVPYARYRATHLRHHCDARLTDPYDDPESYYRSGRDWAATASPIKALMRFNNTLAGRLTIGPLLWTTLFLRGEMHRLRGTPRPILRAWLPHLGGVFVLAVWVVGVCGIDVVSYVLCFAWPGASLIMLRSFAEHQARPEKGPRTAIIETGPLMALLFLNNNLHFAHHKHPRAPWYRLPAIYRAEAEAILAANGGYRINGYLDLVRRYWCRPKEPVAHPYV